MEIKNTIDQSEGEIVMIHVDEQSFVQGCSDSIIIYFKIWTITMIEYLQVNTSM